jgi:hypothetical protein
MTLMTRLFFDYFDIFFLTLILLFVKVWVRFEITNVFCDIITRHKHRLCVRHNFACDVVICEQQMSKTNLHKQQKHCHKKIVKNHNK